MKKQFYIALLSLSVLFVSCKKEEVETTEENELITRVTLSFKDQTGKEVSFNWIDSNGDGVKDSVDPIVLSSTNTYEMEVAFYDDTKKPAEDITEEIEEESDSHLVLVKINPSALMNINATDKDSKGLKLGLKNQVRNLSKGKGILKIKLLHQPPVNGKAIKDGINEGVGSTDAEVDFDITIN